jgi:hypothetical protein
MGMGMENLSPIFSWNGRKVPDFLGTFRPFGISIADITPRRASFTKACVHTLQQHRFATFPMRCRRRRSRRGRNHPARGAIARTGQPGAAGTALRRGRSRPARNRCWTDVLTGCFVTKKFIRVFKMGTDCPSPNLGTDRPGDRSSRGQIIQGTDSPGYGSSRVRFVHGTFHPGDRSLQKSRGRTVKGTDRLGTHRQGTVKVVVALIFFSLYLLNTALPRTELFQPHAPSPPAAPSIALLKKTLQFDILKIEQVLGPTLLRAGKIRGPKKFGPKDCSIQII